MGIRRTGLDPRATPFLAPGVCKTDPARKTKVPDVLLQMCYAFETGAVGMGKQRANPDPKSI